MQPHEIKNIDALTQQYDLLLMEANRKNVMLSAALYEVRQENEYLKGEIEKMKPAQEDGEAPEPKGKAPQKK